MTINLRFTPLGTKKELVELCDRLNSDGFPTVARIIPQSSVLMGGEVPVMYSIDGNGTEVLVLKEKS